MIRSRLLLAAALAVPFTGCATRGDVREIRTELAAIRADVQAARMDAQAARTAATEANTRSKTTEEMVNRGFRKSMYK